MMRTNYWAQKALYLPFHRFCFAIHTNHLSKLQINEFANNTKKNKLKDCKFTIPNIVIIIGESYNKYHSQLYNYNKPTTPYQKTLEDKGKIVVFQDMISPNNITSDVFKNLLSLNDINQKEAWTDKPLFTQLFKKAGYNVIFLTNQFVKSENEDFIQFCGSVFLNNPDISKSQFCRRNTKMHQYDEGLINDYHKITKNIKNQYNLTIFHLIGQHMDYKNRYPHNFKIFTSTDYNRSDLSSVNKGVIADYDNATLYNDFVVNRITNEFEEQDAVIIYFSDHGEECFDENMGVGRSHGEITKNIAKYEFEIPFWIYTTEKFRKNHPEIYNQIVLSRNKPGSTDDIGHMLLYIGGISCPDYNERNNILSPNYNIKKRRMLRNNTDYDKLMSTK